MIGCLAHTGDGYRGEIHAILLNTTDGDIIIQAGQKLDRL